MKDRCALSSLKESTRKFRRKNNTRERGKRCKKPGMRDRGLRIKKLEG
jgi:hypothetical protein